MSKPKKYTKTKANTSISESIAFNPVTAAKPHGFTLNTHSVFKNIINKLAVVKKLKLLTNSDLSFIKSIHRGRLVCRGTNCFHVTVSESLVNRAIHFLDTLAKELEYRKFNISALKVDAATYVFATKDNEHISFQLSEGFKYQPIDNNKRSELERMLYRDRKSIPTGKLTLSISGFETNINKKWSDGTRPIEDALPIIIDGFESLILRQKQRRIENSMRAAQRAEDTKRFGEIESIKYSEKRIYDDAMFDAKTFMAHQNLGEYLNYLEAQYLKECGSLNEVTLVWFSTVRRMAESLNPITKRLKLLSEL